MLLVGNEPLDYLGVITRISNRTKKEFGLVQLGNAEKYERFEYFLRDDLNLRDLEAGDKVLPEFEVTRNGLEDRLNLVKLVRI